VREYFVFDPEAKLRSPLRAFRLRGAESVEEMVAGNCVLIHCDLLCGAAFVGGIFFEVEDAARKFARRLVFEGVACAPDLFIADA
jgi:hypothetical protein